MKKIICLLLMNLCLFSCAQNEKLGYKKLDLENFDFNKKIEDYFSEKKFLQKDNYEIDYDSTNIATTYMTVGDSLSFFGHTYFDGISIMKNNQGKLMALHTFFKHKDIQPLQVFFKYLTHKYGKPTVTKRSGFNSNHTSTYWQLNDRLIVVNSVYDLEKQAVIAGIPDDDVINYVTKMFIVKKEFQNEIVGNLHSDDWMSLDLPDR